ncbi:hypothetical protein SAMN02745866_00953 [Alteromonadaceae bacterium Bs31]|nr:hypothetical protein SAMN02745866_00953 [Alteromonadaceae bacterium Bs31]
MRAPYYFVFFGILSLLISACGKPPEYDQQTTETPRVIKSADTPIDELMDRSGANARLVRLPQKILVSADQQLRKGVVHVDEIRPIILQTFNPGELREVARTHLQNSLDAEEVEQVLSWLNSDLGKKVAAMEVQGARPEAHNASRDHYSELKKNEPRVALVRELDEANKASVQEVELVLTTQKSMMIALRPALPEEARITEAQFAERAEEMRPNMLKRYQQVVEATNLYNYQALTDDELRAYIAFANSHAGRNYYRVLAEAIQSAVSYGSGHAGAKVAEFMAKQAS